MYRNVIVKGSPSSVKAAMLNEGRAPRRFSVVLADIFPRIQDLTTTWSDQYIGVYTHP